MKRRTVKKHATREHRREWIGVRRQLGRHDRAEFVRDPHTGVILLLPQSGFHPYRDEYMPSKVPHHDPECGMGADEWRRGMTPENEDA